MSKKSRSKVGTIGRRDFLKTSAAGLAGLAFGGCATAPRSGERTPASVGSDNEYEYIVVGSGAGGGPLAANLARRGFRVLLLEAGGLSTKRDTVIPALHAQSTEEPEIAWNYYVNLYSDTERAKKNSKYVSGKGVLYPRAGTVGGCSVHNAMITMYPENRDFDSIARLTNDSSWNAREMRRHFMNIERNHYYKNNGVNLSRNGFDGWLDTNRADVSLALKDRDLRAVIESTVGQQNILSDIVHRIIAEAGNFPPDPNKWQYALNKTGGLFNVPLSTKDGQRSGPREYILDTLKSTVNSKTGTPNLVLKTNSLAKRILFSSQDASKAVGVEYYEGQSLYSADPRSQTSRVTSAAPVRQVFATREVILAGGAFNSPQLLMLSGIGDPDELRAKGVQGPYIALPGVGQNLQDRYEIGVVSQMSHPFDVIKNCTFGEEGDPCLKDYEINPERSIYSTNGVIISLMRKSGRRQADPDLCIFGLPGHFAGYYPGWGKDAYNAKQFTWAVLKGHTHNTGGRVRLRSSNPFETPEINFHYFDEGNGNWNEDLIAVMDGVKVARRMNETLTGRGILTSELLPGPDVSQSASLREYILRESWGHHASCSNKMGVATDEQAVVDSEFRVHKTKNLRIVDASVFPKIPGLFIALPIYMIADKAAEAIAKDAKG